MQAFERLLTLLVAVTGLRIGEVLALRWKARRLNEIYQRNLDWLNFWLQDKEDPDPAKAEQYKRWRELRKLQDAQTGGRKVN
jgi:hypothetical protein